MITDQEQDIITSIFKQIAQSVVLSIQFVNEANLMREGYVLGIMSYNRYESVYINVKDVTPWQIKTFEKRVKKDLPNRGFIEKHDDITRFVFK